MTGQENQNTAIKGRPRLSIKLLTLIPIFVLSFVCIISNIVAVHNIRSVNRTASTIADDYMTGIFNLSNIQRETQRLHSMALSHIIATDLDTMVELVDSIRAEEALLDNMLLEYGAAISPENAASYEKLLSEYENLKYAIVTLFGYSAAGPHSNWQTARSHSTRRTFRMPSPC